MYDELATQGDGYCGFGTEWRVKSLLVPSAVLVRAGLFCGELGVSRNIAFQRVVVCEATLDPSDLCRLAEMERLKKKTLDPKPFRVGEFGFRAEGLRV